MNRTAADLPRAVNLLAGIWLFISAFVWSHTSAGFTNTWLVGLLAVAFSLIAMRAVRAWFLSTALAVWLFISAFALPHTSQTLWNNAMVAALIFVMSLIPPGDTMDVADDRRGGAGASAPDVPPKPRTA